MALHSETNNSLLFFLFCMSATAGEAAVEFETSSSPGNSLDMRIFGSFDGAIAIQYYSLRRLITRACVQVCNENNWVIPFTQLTLHQGQGFEQLRGANTEPGFNNT